MAWLDPHGLAPTCTAMHHHSVDWRQGWGGPVLILPLVYWLTLGVSLHHSVPQYPQFVFWGQWYHPPLPSTLRSANLRCDPFGIHHYLIKVSFCLGDYTDEILGGGFVFCLKGGNAFLVAIPPPLLLSICGEINTVPICTGLHWVLCPLFSEPPVSFSRLPCSGAASACPPGKSEHAWSPADRQQKMAKLQEPGDGLGEGILVAPELDGSRLAGNRLNLDVYPDGCHQFLDLFDKQRKEVTQVEFLRLNCNEDLIISTLAILPALRTLKSLVLKGKPAHLQDKWTFNFHCALAALCSGSRSQLSWLGAAYKW